MPQYDNFTTPMSAGDALSKLNGAFSSDPGVGHTHNPNSAGQGGKIPTNALSGMVATSVLSGSIATSVLSGNIATSVLSGNIAGSNVSGPVAVADTTKGDTRFQVSGGRVSGSLSSSSAIYVYQIRLVIPTGKNLVVKGARFYFNDSKLRVGISLDDGMTSWMSSASNGDVTPNAVVPGGAGTKILYVLFKNSSDTLSATININDGWWFDLSME
jgi:hypothetical protein